MKDKSKFVLQILDEMLQALEAGVDRAPQVKMQGDIKPGSTVLIGSILELCSKVGDGPFRRRVFYRHI